MPPTPGNDLILGDVVGRNEPLTLSRTERDKHLYVCGATGTGKSKFLEHLIRQDIKNWRRSKCGLVLLDPHGSLYDSLMAWLAYHDLDRPVLPIDLRNDKWVVGYNVLRRRPSADPAVIVSNFVQAMAYVWGQSGTDQTPLFARWASNILRTLYDNGATLLDAEHLTNHMAKQIRHAMTEAVKNPSIARDWQYANALSPRDFEAQISSTINRLHRFLDTQAMRNMFGQQALSLDLGKALEEGWIILVNLATEGAKVSEEDASLFATLLLSDLWTAAKERGKGSARNPVKPCYVYVDEFQNFVTPTIAKNLDQARGFGLHLTLAHQFPNQLLHAGAHGKEVYDSIMVNARSKVVFGIDGEENLRPLAQALFMGAMNPNKIKLELHSTKVMNYVEEYRSSYGKSVSEGYSTGQHTGHAAGHGTGSTVMNTDGEMSLSESRSEFEAGSNSRIETESRSVTQSESRAPMLIPVMGKEPSSVQFESLDEQLFRAMAVLFDQQQRQCVARVVGSRTPVSLFTPTVNTVPQRAERVQKYLERQLNRWPFAISTSDAEKRLADREAHVTGQLVQQMVDEPETTKRRIK